MQNCPKWSRIGRNRSGVVPDTPGTLLDHFWDNTCFKKAPKIMKTSRRPKTDFSESMFFPINVKSQWDFLTNRELELIYKARQMRNLGVIWFFSSLYIFYVSSRPRPISEKLVFKPFCYGWTLILT